MKKIYTYIILGMSSLFFLHSCVEPFEKGTLHFENTLVIEATITNELKYQEISLSRTYRLEDNKKPYEINAQVTVVDAANNTYNFQEIDSGTYKSIAKFAVLPNRTYKLAITTSDGKKYGSTAKELTSANAAFNITATKETNAKGIEGISIYANSFDPTNSSKYYRYTYEETYKIIAPNWSPLDAFGESYLPTVPNPPPYHEVYTLPKAQEERVCYGTSKSNTILQIDTNLLTEDRVDNFLVLFLPIDEFKITHRYSILVHQLIESPEVYSFYKTLDKFSDSENVFSQKQQGFVPGNVHAVDNPDENVLGYFEVSAVASERIFFNFEDFFPTADKPPYITECNIIAPDLDDRSQFGSPDFSPLINQLFFYNFKFVDFNDPKNNPNNPYFIVRRECGDCTALGSNVKPSFWID
ncbi:MAG: hypothetical protein ACI9SI_001020 [Polaribacter sp.]|jgi:hypothetical protein